MDVRRRTPSHGRLCVRMGLAAPVLALSAMLPARPAPSIEADIGYNRGSASILQCVPYARRVSGIQIFGDASGWWDKAEGHYARGRQPQRGSILAFRATGAMPGGHVAMVSRVIGQRQVLLDHANWSYRGGIERDVLAEDVSDENDWSQVRVWYGPSGQLGSRTNPAFGFIYPGKTPSERTEPERRFQPLGIDLTDLDAPAPSKAERRAMRDAERAADREEQRLARYAAGHAPRLTYDRRVFGFEPSRSGQNAPTNLLPPGL